MWKYMPSLGARKAEPPAFVIQMTMRTATLCFLLAAANLAAETPSLETLRGRFEASLASWRALPARQGVSPAEELAVRSRLMKDLAAWMSAEQSNAAQGAEVLDKLGRDLVLPGAQEAALAAARRNASVMLAAVQAKAERLRVLENIAGLLPDPAALERMDAEISALAEHRKQLGRSLNSIEDTVARLGWHAWLFERQAHSAAVLHEIYESRLARSSQAAARERDLLGIDALVREFQAGSLPEWPVMDNAGRPLDRKKLDKAVKRVLRERN